MITEKMEKMLNDQLAKEFFASHYYLSIASWCDSKGYSGTANFFYLQSQEEREHAMKFFHYINELNGYAVMPALEKPPTDFEGYRKIFELSLETERENTKSIHEIVEHALSEKDYSTNNFLQWFVDEQVEEENLFMGILDKIDIIGTEGPGLYMLDKDLGKRQDTHL